jgi:hypothetical protein
MNLWLDPIPSALQEQAVEALEAGDALGFLCLASNEYSLDLVFGNLTALRERGIYEQALAHAFIATRTNNRRWSTASLQCLFSFSDRSRLLAAGDPLPGNGPFTVYRGVAGRGSGRRVRGFSWTASHEKARWFAARSAWFGLPDPGVFRVTVEQRDVLFYSNQRNEQEYIILLPEKAKPVLVERVVVEQDAPASA